MGRDNNNEKVQEVLNNITAIMLLGSQFLSGEYISKLGRVLKKVVDAGNEFILGTPYLYWFVYNTINSGTYFSGPNMNTLIKDLDCFTTNDRNVILDKIASIYEGISFVFDRAIYDRDLYLLRTNIVSGNIPLSVEYNNQITATYSNQGIETDDCGVFKTILAIIVGYCLLNNCNDFYDDYCKLFTEDPTLVIDDLALNKIIEYETPGWYKVQNMDSLIKYILYKIDNREIKTREVK